VQYTTDVLFRDLWLRPDLAPRERSLVTVSALIANGQTAQLTPHLNRAMDNGLTQTEASEAITQWPSTSAGPTSSRRCRLRRMCSKSVHISFSIPLSRSDGGPVVKHIV